MKPQPQELIHNVWVLICLSDLKHVLETIHHNLFKWHRTLPEKLWVCIFVTLQPSLTRKYLTQLQPLAACTMISPRSPSAFPRTPTHSPPDCAVSSQDASAQKCPSQTVGSCYTSSKSSSHVCSEVSHSFNLRQQKDVNFKVRVV